MSSFTTPLQVELIGKWKFKLLTPFEYHIGGYPTKYQDNIIRIPQNFIADFTSIPRFIWLITSPIDGYAKAAVIHDWLYHSGIYSKKRTEKIFKESMEVLNAPFWKKNLIYLGVYLFGHLKWQKYRRIQKRKKL